MNKQKTKPLIKIDGRANKEDVDLLKKHNINISWVIRDAISQEANKLRQQMKVK